jgi:hypothetical protein
MFKINDKEIVEYEKDLKVFARKAFPFATKNTLNRLAFTSQKIIRKDLKVKMVLRNKFTEKSIQVDQARTLNVRKQSSTVGSIAPYLKDQETGAVKTKKGKKGVSIATSYSAGQGRGVQPRTRLSRKGNKLENISLQRRRKKGSNRKQNNIITIRDAAESGRKFVFLDLGRRQGIFKVTGGKRRPKIQMVHDLSSQSVTIPRNAWLKPAVDTVLVMLPKFYKDALRFQLKRHGLFTG